MPKRVLASKVQQTDWRPVKEVALCVTCSASHHGERDKHRLYEPYGSVELTFPFSLKELGKTDVLTILIYILASNSSVCSQRSKEGYLYNILSSTKDVSRMQHIAKNIHCC